MGTARSLAQRGEQPAPGRLLTALSIEHEDGLMSNREGFEKAVKFLQDIVIQEQPGAILQA